MIPLSFRAERMRERGLAGENDCGETGLSECRLPVRTRKGAACGLCRNMGEAQPVPCGNDAALKQDLPEGEERE